MGKARIYFIGVLICNAVFAYSQPKIGISGTLEWDKLRINSVVSLDMASAGLSLPGGRMQGEALIATEYARLIRPAILNIQVDSSSKIADIVNRGEWNSMNIEDFALQSRSVPPALSPDFSSMAASYTLSLESLSAALIRHQRPADVPRTLNPVPAPVYTGIVIIASEALPVHGMKSTALVRPCLFPKIWDTEMKLLFERNMLDPGAGAMVHYCTAREIFTSAPSGLSPEITAIVGSRPLRIFARSVFGIQPTDPIISREDALQIISNEGNHRLLREGRVAIIINDAMLTSPLPRE